MATFGSLSQSPHRSGAPTRGRPTASPVTVRHPDGHVDQQPAYSADELKRIDRRAAKTPRTWDEINSSHGGGQDFGPRR